MYDFVVVPLIMTDGRHTYLLILLSIYIRCRPVVGYRLICIPSWAQIPLEIVKFSLFDRHEWNVRR